MFFVFFILICQFIKKLLQNYRLNFYILKLTLISLLALCIFQRPQKIDDDNNNNNNNNNNNS